MYHFCTILSQSNFYKAQALAESLNGFNFSFILHVLITDGNAPAPSANIRIWNIKNLEVDEPAAKIISKYRYKPDKLRWSLKPGFMHFLLQQQETDRLIYIDSDILFFNSPEFIFELLKQHSIILTPHYYNDDPHKNQNWLEANFQSGLYNAGFVAASKTGLATLQWWANCCAYRCEKNFIRGTFHDQRYLDLVTVIDENAYILRHKGCNVARWNLELSPRTMQNGEVLINGSFPIIFIHFSDITIRCILNGADGLLLGHFEQYEKMLKRYNPGFERGDVYAAESLSDKLKYMAWRAMN